MKYLYYKIPYSTEYKWTVAKQMKLTNVILKKLYKFQKTTEIKLLFRDA